MAVVMRTEFAIEGHFGNILAGLGRIAKKANYLLLAISKAKHIHIIGKIVSK